MIGKYSIIVCILFIAFSQNGCVHKPVEQSQAIEVTTPPPIEEKKQDLVHTISISGETLGLIAKWYTGDPANWVKIRDANPGTVPERLRIGSQLTIPGDLVIKREALTADYVKSEIAAYYKLSTSQAAQVSTSKTQSMPAEQVGAANQKPASTDTVATSESAPPQTTISDQQKQEQEDVERLKALKARKSDHNAPTSVTPDVSTGEHPQPPPPASNNDVSQNLNSQKQTGGLFKEETRDSELKKENIAPTVSPNNSKATPTNEEDEERQKLLRELLGGK